MSYQPIEINQFDQDGGLFNYLEARKIPNEAFTRLEDAYAWRNRIKRRRGFTYLGRLQRKLSNVNIGTVGSLGGSFNLKSIFTITEPNAEIAAGSLVINITASTISNTLKSPGYYYETADCEVISNSTTGLSNGDTVNITGVVVVPGTGSSAINTNGPYSSIEVISGTNFKLGIPNSGWGRWQSGGTWTKNIGAIVLKDQGNGLLATSPPSANTGTINYITGAVTFTTVAAGGSVVGVQCGYYPALPVMGLRLQDTAVNNQKNFISFDTTYAYQFIGNPTPSFEELPSNSNPVTWSGEDFQLFWTTNYWFLNGKRLFWVTNFNNGQTAPGGTATYDPMYYYDSQNWNNFTPVVSGTATTPSDASTIVLWTCLILIPYKGRLLAFNTFEGNNLGSSNQTTATQYPNRLRWSQQGNPVYDPTGSPPKNPNAWKSDIVGFGGFLDAPTTEAIIGVEFIKDILLVKFERSSWKINYTGNPAIPFLFEKINTELGAEATFSLIPFDQGVFSVGNYGITTDNSINVERIDRKIPQQVFQIANANQGIERVYGIRDYTNELVYWSFPNGDTSPKFNNQVLVYNYVNQTWAIFNDSFTCYGYFQNPQPYTWATIPATITWETWNDPWGGANDQSFYPEVIAGNQQGFVMQISDQIGNGPSLAIYGITQDSSSMFIQLNIVNHNLQTGQFIVVNGVLGTITTGQTNPSFLNGNTYKVVFLDNNNILLQDATNNYIRYPQPGDSGIGTYIGAGTVTILNNLNVWTKRFAPFSDSGQQTRLGYVDFLCDATTQGQFTCNLYIDENDTVALNNPSIDQSVENDPVTASSTILTTPENLAIFPFQQKQLKIWHRFFAYLIAQDFQLQLTMSDNQMFGVPNIPTSLVPTLPGCPTSEILIPGYKLYISNNARLAP